MVKPKCTKPHIGFQPIESIGKIATLEESFLSLTPHPCIHTLWDESAWTDTSRALLCDSRSWHQYRHGCLGGTRGNPFEFCNPLVQTQRLKCLLFVQRLLLFPFHYLVNWILGQVCLQPVRMDCPSETPDNMIMHSWVPQTLPLLS